MDTFSLWSRPIGRRDQYHSVYAVRRRRYRTSPGGEYHRPHRRACAGASDRRDRQSHRRNHRRTLLAADRMGYPAGRQYRIFLGSMV